MNTTSRYSAIWVVDLEFRALAGERPEPICLVAKNVITDEEIRLWEGQLHSLPRDFFSAPDILVVAYFASAEVSCFLALNFTMPHNLLDLYVEFRNRCNGRHLPCGAGLIGSAVALGLDSMGADEKSSMRSLALREGPYTAQERDALLDYCGADVALTVQVFNVMRDSIDWPRALLRGQYMIAVARMERTGIPIDVETLSRLRSSWESVQDELIARIDARYLVYEGRSFKKARFEAYLTQNTIPWPRLEGGALALDDDTFREMTRRYPILAPLRELRSSLSQMRLTNLSVGMDGRNRCLLSPFASKTGRNQPSNSQFIFGPSVWLRGLIQPPSEWSIAYVDWSQQEFGIAAALSGDVAMQEAYLSGDPYLAFAIQAGAAPSTATKKSHSEVRDQFKSTVLAVQYGMSAESLAVRIGQSPARGHQLMRLHRETYPTYWRWSEGAVNHALARGCLHTVFGWRVQLPDVQLPNDRSLMNFPMQANGAEMLRIACIRLTNAGLRVCAPIHDALLVEGPTEQIKDVVAATQRMMRIASSDVLAGFELRSDVKIIESPNRYMDPRGEAMWGTVMDILEKREHACPEGAR